MKLGKFVVLGVVSAMVLVFSAGCENKKVGDACETYRSSECGGPNGACLSGNGPNYCSHECNAPTDCPTGFKCGDITSTTYNGKGEQKGSKQVKMCVKS